MAVKNLNSVPLGCEDVKIFYCITYGTDLPLSSSYQKWREYSSKILVTTFQIRLHNNAEHVDRPINPQPFIRGWVISREVEIFPNIMES